MTKILSFHEHVVAIAKKTEAARANRQPDPNPEKPRDVIFAALEEIAESLRPEGFTFLRSGPKLKRVQGDLTFQIPFQSDRNNFAGSRAGVWIHAGVHSQALAKWRRSHPLPWHGTGPGLNSVTGGQIGNLLDEPTWMDWDFADVSRRKREIEVAISAIRRIILPFFALFDDPANAVNTLVHRPLLWRPSLLEYASVAIGREAAEVAGRSILRRNPKIRRPFEEGLARVRYHGLPRYRSGLGIDLAAVAVALDLDLSDPGQA